MTFSEEAFLAQKPGAPLQAFHRRAVHLQLFKQFIEGRLEKLNTGEGFSDLFEEEITCSGAFSERWWCPPAFGQGQDPTSCQKHVPLGELG